MDKNGLSAVTGHMPHPHFRKCTIILGRPTPGRQQMPMFGDICYITLPRQSWLQGRFPCHVGPLAELCWNLEASHLQNTLTTVWGHLLVSSGFRVGLWPLHTFSSRVLELGLRVQVRPSSQQVQPGSQPDLTTDFMWRKWEGPKPSTQNTQLSSFTAQWGISQVSDRYNCCSVCSTVHTQSGETTEANTIAWAITVRQTPGRVVYIHYIIQSTSPPTEVGIIIPRPYESKESHLWLKEIRRGNGGFRPRNRTLTQTMVCKPAGLCAPELWKPPGPGACSLFSRAVAFLSSTRKTCGFMFFPHLLLRQALLFEERPLALLVSR